MSDLTRSLAELLHRALIDADLVLVPTARHSRSPGQQRQALAARLVAAGVTVAPAPAPETSGLRALALVREIFDPVGDCSACGGAQYGTEDAVQEAVVAAKLALGEPLRGYEQHRLGELNPSARAALAGERP